VQCRHIDAESFGFPFATQLIAIRRHRFYLSDGHSEEGFIHLLCSRQTDPDDALMFGRGHWGIETRVHYTRDANFHEDRCRIRNTVAAHVCATLRTLANCLLGRRANGSRKNTRRRQYRRIARRPALALALVLSKTN
jgi:predicted transposase YbfD/YdcC